MNALKTPRLVLRNWEDRDRDAFHRINSDETVMEFFPNRRDRAQSDALMDELRTDIARDGFGFAAVALAPDGEAIGFCGLNETDDMPGRPEAIEIGWRLVPEHWGKGLATEAAEAWLRHGFDTLGLDTIIAFAVEANLRSTSVMARLGMSPRPTMDFDHPRVPDSHPHLKRMVVYELARDHWRRPDRDNSAGFSVRSSA